MTVANGSEVRSGELVSQTLSLSGGIPHPSRLRTSGGLSQNIPAWEVAVLAISGAIAAASVGLVELRLRIPGHSILHAVLPMALGLSLAPRRYAGSGMSLAAMATAFCLQLAGRGEFGAGSWTSLASMGPALDLMLASRLGQRWPAFSIAIAGLLANACAFVAKSIEKWSEIVPHVPGSGMGGGRGLGGGGGNGMGGGKGLGGGRGLGAGLGRTWDEWIAVAPYTYLLCGLLAGLLCGAVLFRVRRRIGSDPLRTPQL